MGATNEPPVRWRHWGCIRYAEALVRQRARWEAVHADAGPEAIFTLEHEPVITLGRRGSRDDIRASADTLAARGIDVVDTDRGGEVTYHGPGQLVVYPILAVGRRGIAVGDLVRGIAGVLADWLSTFGVDATYDPKRPGLWVAGAKIAAVGMRISRGVSLHGAAINLTTALDAYELFVPCGLPEAPATSLAALGGDPPPMTEAGRDIAIRLASHFALGPLDGVT